MPRMLAIFMPNGRSVYWLTERVFEVGDTFERSGERWLVTSVGEMGEGEAKQTRRRRSPCVADWRLRPSRRVVRSRFARWEGFARNARAPHLSPRSLG
jgi:hypothetical protein